MTDVPAPDAGTEQAAAPPARPARRRLLALTLSVAAGVIVLDQVSKWAAQTYLAGREPVQVLGDWLQLRYLLNSGAAFSLGNGMTIIFTAVACVVAVVIVKTASNLGSRLWAVALGGMLGGALGNLVDRVFRYPGVGRGYVIDWIQLPNWPVFNVADMAVVGGAILMGGLVLFGVDLDGSRGRG